MAQSQLPGKLCSWCVENTFGLSTIAILQRASTGKLGELLKWHTTSQEPFYFWSSRPFHSGWELCFHRTFQSVIADAEQGCIFCSFLIAAAKQSPPRNPELCFFEGPLREFPDIQVTINAVNEQRAQQESRVQSGYFEKLDPNWRTSNTYGHVVANAIEAGLPRDSLLLAYKMGDDQGHPCMDMWNRFSDGNPCVPLMHRFMGSKLKEERSKGGTDPRDYDFAFTLVFNEPWDTGTIYWPYKSSGPDFGVNPTNCFFRLYPIEPRESWGVLPEPTIEDAAWDSIDFWDESGGQLPPAQALDRDGVIMRMRMEDCISNHDSCAIVTNQTLPSRLLRLSGTTSSPLICLVDTDNILARPILYACLSYCWGGPQPGMTVEANVPAYTVAMDPNNLPKTVQDAVKVALSLSLEYLWVDAYCIVQDSFDDKTNELAKMSSIYQDAYCTIAAMTARSALEGFLGSDDDDISSTSTWNIDLQSSHQLFESLDRPSQRMAVVEMQKDFKKPSPSGESIMTRAWTLQESLLSPRLLMYFSPGQPPTLRCKVCTTRADGGIVLQTPMSLGTLQSNHTSNDLGLAKRLVFWSGCKSRLPAEFTREKMYPGITNLDEWYTIVEEYSKRNLTNYTDKLPALAGIVAHLERTGNLGTYHGGLWSKFLMRSLLWVSQGKDPIFLAIQATSNRAAYDTYVGPTWSWVSRNHPVYYTNDFDDVSEASVLSCEVNPQVPLLPNGAIKSASITLLCPAKLCVVTAGWNSKERGFVFDDEPMPSGIESMWLIQLMSEEPYNTRHAVGLGVVETEELDFNGEKLYRRVGMFHHNGGEHGPWNDMRRFILI